MDTDPARREARLIVLRRSPERLEALKRAMAQFLGGVLSIRDAGVRTENGLVEPTLSPHKIVRRPSLAKLFLDRGGYLPSMQMLRDEYETQQLLNTIQSVRKSVSAGPPIARRRPRAWHRTKHRCFQELPCRAATARCRPSAVPATGWLSTWTPTSDSGWKLWPAAERDGVPPRHPGSHAWWPRLRRPLRGGSRSPSHRRRPTPTSWSPPRSATFPEGGGRRGANNRCVDCLGVA